MERIKCPKCNHEFDYENPYISDLESKMYKDFEERYKLRLNQEVNKIKGQSSSLDIELRNLREKLAQKDEEFKEELIRIKKEEKEEREKIRLEEKAEREKIRLEDREYFTKQRESDQKKIDELNAKLIALIEEKDEEVKRTEEQLKKELETRERVNLERLKNEKQALEEKLENERLENERMRNQVVSLKENPHISQQRQGEIMELIIEEKLRSWFIFDSIEEVKKGVYGEDIVQIVKNRHEETCGIIVYESKNAQLWQNAWVDKIKENRTRNKANFSVIITKVMPPKHETDAFAVIDEIFVIKKDYEILRLISSLLRSRIEAIYKLKKSQENSQTKENELREFVTSEQFRVSLNNIISRFQFMRENINKQRNSMEKFFSEQEKSLDFIVKNIQNSSGSIQSILEDSRFLDEKEDEFF